MTRTGCTNDILIFLTLALALALHCDGYMTTIRQGMTMRRGKGNLKKTFGVGNSQRGKPKSLDITSPNVAASLGAWMDVLGVKSMSDMPKAEGTVSVVETMAEPLKDSQTNPNGAVSVVNYSGRTYCFSVSCPTCKIPLTKAKVLDPNDESGDHPRIYCDFCSATFDAFTGKALTRDKSTKKNLLGGVISTLLSKDEEQLPTYELGEKNGKVLIRI